MARRQQTSTLDDIFFIACKLPWKISAALAVIAIPILHAIASRPAVKLTGLADVGAVAVHSIFTTFAFLGQFIVPLIFAVGAIVSAIQSKKQRHLYEGVRQRSDIGVLNEMSWQDFERLIAEHFQRKGFHVSREGGNGPDGGVDLVLRRGREKHLVQCKQWRAYQVGVQPVREFYGVMAANGVTGGYFVTSGVFSEDALQFVRGLNLELIDGKNLKEIIGGAAKRGPAPLTARREQRVPFGSNSQTSTLMPPACPKCGASMMRRTARRGVNPGQEFWGCSTYPKCNGTIGFEDAAPEPTPAAPVSKPLADQIKRVCPYCGTDLVLKKFQGGPKEGQEFYGCVPCRKGWPIELAPPA